MEKAEELKKLTRDTLGDGPGAGFYAKVDRMLEDGDWSNTSLVSATREIEKMVKLFVGIDSAGLLEKRYSEYFKSHKFKIEQS